MLAVWVQIGGGALLILVFGTLLKCVADIGQIKGTVSTIVSRVDGMDSDIRDLRNEMSRRFLEMNTRFLRIENILMGRPPGPETPPTGD